MACNPSNTGVRVGSDTASSEEQRLVVKITGLRDQGRLSPSTDAQLCHGHFGGNIFTLKVQGWGIVPMFLVGLSKKCLARTNVLYQHLGNRPEL